MKFLIFVAFVCLVYLSSTTSASSQDTNDLHFNLNNKAFIDSCISVFSQQPKIVKEVTSLANDTSLVLYDDGSVGIKNDRDNIFSKVSDFIQNGVVNIYSTANGFAILKKDGSVFRWTYEIKYDKTDYTKSKILDSIKFHRFTGIKSIIANMYAFAAITVDNSVRAWGAREYGGDIQSIANILTNVRAIYRSALSFAVIRFDNSVISWGDSKHGGDSTWIRKTLVDVEKIQPLDLGFIAVTKSNETISWGIKNESKQLLDSLTTKLSHSYTDTDTNDDYISSGINTSSKKVKSVIYTSYYSYTLYSDGSLISSEGDNLSDSYTITFFSVAHLLKEGVRKIYSTTYHDAFVAVKFDGTVVTWGKRHWGGDSSLIQDKLVGVKEIYPLFTGFAALREDNSIIIWGDGESSLQEQFSELEDKLSSGVKTVISNGFAIAVIKEDNSVVTFGYPSLGGDSSEVQDKLVNVKEIYCNRAAFVAVKDDNTTVGWGANFLAVQDLLEEVNKKLGIDNNSETKDHHQNNEDTSKTTDT